MPGRPSVKSAFQNLRPTILRDPVRSEVTAEAEARLLHTTVPKTQALPEHAAPEPIDDAAALAPAPATLPLQAVSGGLLQRKKRERLLLVSFRMPQSLKEKLENVAKMHEVNQTDLINEAIEINLQRYV